MTKTRSKPHSKKSSTTFKKTKVVGTQEYINPSTGEIVPMEVMQVEDKDYNFMKVFLVNFMAQLEGVTNKKTQVMFYIIDNLNNENILLKTQEQVAQETNVSRRTVAQTFKMLLDADFMKKINNSIYQVNPNSLFKGHHSKRMNLLIEYTDIGKDKNNE